MDHKDIKNTKTKRLYIIDGTAFAFRSFHAIKDLRAPDGRPTNAIFGFVKTLMKLLNEQAVEYVAVSFDTGAPTFRHERFAEYKAHRAEAPDEMKSQFEPMREVVDAMGIPIVMIEGWEADDVLGTLARRAVEAGMHAVVVTNDKDALQLVTDKVSVYDPNRDDGWYDPEKVTERFHGVRPEQVTEMMGLMGDATDNIPGVAGIGPKTAEELIGRYGTVDNLYDHLDEIKGKRRENLVQCKDLAFLSRELATIATDVPLDITPEQCRWRGYDKERLADLFRSLGFLSLLREFTPETEECLDYRTVTTMAELERVVETLRKKGRFVLDVETTSTDAMRARLVGISFCCRSGEAWYVPVGHRTSAGEGGGELFDSTGPKQLPLETVTQTVGPLLSNDGIKKAGQNIKYDMTVLKRHGLEVHGVNFDTMVASYLLNPSRSQHNLDALALEFLGRKKIATSELLGKGAKATTMDFLPVEQVAKYSCEDADVTWRLMELFEPQLKEKQLWDLFEKLEVPLIEVLMEMEMAGVAIDVELFGKLSRSLQRELDDLTKQIYEAAGGEFNINSPKQMAEILFDKLQLPVVRRTKSGPSTDLAVLEELAQHHPLPELIVKYRTLEKLRGTYVDALPAMVNPETGRIHTSFNQTVAATGRLSSSDPNLQNIPVRTEMGREIRRGFVPGSADEVLLSADYSQIELRVLAHMSGDAELSKSFLEGADIHTRTASRLFGVAEEAVTLEMRWRAKTVNFGILYGMGPFRIAKDFGISREEAQSFIDNYFGLYPRVKELLAKLVKDAEEKGYVETILKRRRYFPELRTSDARARQLAERAAINAPIQGSAADIIKLAMIRIPSKLREKRLCAKMILQVHDELLFEVAKQDLEVTRELVVQTMENALELSVPLVVEAGWGKNWLEAH